MIRTEDDQIVSAGDLVYDYYDMEPGFIVEGSLDKMPSRREGQPVPFDAKRDIWFTVRTDSGQHILNGERICSVSYAVRRGFPNKLDGIVIERRNMLSNCFAMIAIPFGEDGEFHHNVIAEREPTTEVWRFGDACDSGHGDTLREAIGDFLDKSKTKNASRVGHCEQMIDTILPLLESHKIAVEAMITEVTK